MDLSLLRNWVPVRFLPSERPAAVDWAYLGDERFTDPFFEQTIARCLRRPADVVFRHRTPVDVLREMYEQRGGVEPAGFIFHMSRCGSTLIAQMLAAIERHVVLSEVPFLDEILLAPLDEEQRVERLRWAVSALAQRRRPEEAHAIIKFDSWHVLQLPLIQRAFPGVPWIFVYREPLEVLVSHQRQRGGQMVPVVVSPATFGLETGESWVTRLNEYCARVLATLCEAALAHRHCGRGRLVNFRELPAAVPDSLLKWFGLTCTDDEMSRLNAAAEVDAKRPGARFDGDVALKHRLATADLRQLADTFVRPAYRRLEAARLAQGGA